MSPTVYLISRYLPSYAFRRVCKIAKSGY